MPRQYIKKNSNYWNRKSETLTFQNVNQENSFSPVAVASIGGSSRLSQIENSSLKRANSITFNQKSNQYTNIDNLTSPFSCNSDYITASEAIELCQKAYVGFPAFRNAIDILSEFANTPFYLVGGNKKSKDFVSAWLEMIDFSSMCAQHFREFFRSGNVFYYRIDGKFKDGDYLNLIKSFGAKKNDIPIKYLLLNPVDIAAKDSASFSSPVYVKGLNKYEAEKLRIQRTEKDKEIFDALPEDVKSQIKSGGFSTLQPIQIPLDSSRLHTCFYKKQDYEAFAIPYGYAVLDDINWKLELKKIDQSICRTIENVILLVTMGSEKSVNNAAIQKMQELLSHGSIGRAIVSDYTTKIDFVIPDLKKVLGKDKYEIVDRDISEGLLNIMSGDGEKFANQQIKISVFLERLKESREAFIQSVIQPEIKRVCRNLGFKQYPQIKFQQVTMKDEVQIAKLYQRLLELGVLTPEDCIQALETGVLPEYANLLENQKKFKEQKDAGLFVPLTYNNPGEVNTSAISNEGGRPDGTGTPKESNSQSPIGQGEQSKAQLMKEYHSAMNIIDITKKMNSFINASINKYKEKSGKDTDEEINKFISNLCFSIASRKEYDKWEESVEELFNNPNRILAFETEATIPEIIEISDQYEIDNAAASILYHSKKIETL